MDIETASYTSRQAMVKGVMTMSGEGWQVCGISTLAENCYRVEFSRQVPAELAVDTDLAGPIVGNRETTRQQTRRAACPQ